MPACATLLGLLCLAGLPKLISDNPPPRLWSEERVKADGFDLTYLQSDARYVIPRGSLRRMCKSHTCILYDVRAEKCAIAFHVFQEVKDASYDGGDSYTLTPASAAVFAAALSQVWVNVYPSHSSHAITLADLPEIKSAHIDCG